MAILKKSSKYNDFGVVFFLKLAFLKKEKNEIIIKCHM
jgi:hypothetical protein